MFLRLTYRRLCRAWFIQTRQLSTFRYWTVKPTDRQTPLNPHASADSTRQRHKAASVKNLRLFLFPSHTNLSLSIQNTLTGNHSADIRGKIATNFSVYQVSRLRACGLNAGFNYLYDLNHTSRLRACGLNEIWLF